MSRYSLVLNKMIAESGLTAKEIVEKCNEAGNGIDTTRLSKLQNGKLPAPSEKLSRELAKACNSDDKELVLEGYLEKAPKEIMDALLTIKNMVTISAMNSFENAFDESVLDYIKKEMEKEPLAKFIISLIEDSNFDLMLDENNKIKFDVDDENLNIILQNPVQLKVNDNSMFPIIPKDAEISLKIQNEYSDGDILAIKVKKTEGFIVRYAMLKNKSIVLTSLNPKEYEKLEYKNDEVVILGKVIKVTINIQE